MAFARLILIALACAAFAGCSAKQVFPETTPSNLYRTPIDGVTAQLILPNDFQRTTITQKPSLGRAWSIYNFEMPVGTPLSKGLSGDIRSRVPAARVGNTDDGKPAALRVTATDVSITFGVDEGNAVLWTALSPIGLGSDISVDATATVTATITANGRPPRPVSVTGSGAIPMAYISLREADLGRAVGLALDDAVMKLGDIYEAEARQP